MSLQFEEIFDKGCCESTQISSERTLQRAVHSLQEAEKWGLLQG